MPIRKKWFDLIMREKKSWNGALVNEASWIVLQINLQMSTTSSTLKVRYFTCFNISKHFGFLTFKLKSHVWFGVILLKIRSSSVFTNQSNSLLRSSFGLSLFWSGIWYENQEQNKRGGCARWWKSWTCWASSYWDERSQGSSIKNVGILEGVKIF